MNEGGTPSFQAYKVGTPELGYMKLTRIAAAQYIALAPRDSAHEHYLSHHPYPPSNLTQDTSSARWPAQGNSSGPLNSTRHCAGAKTDGIQPLYDHRAQKCTMTRSPHSQDSSQMLSGFWEVNGIRAHCLLNSSCEGVMISPDFARAMGMTLAKLEQPSGLQSACVGSKSTINYGTKTTIVFGDAHQGVL